MHWTLPARQPFSLPLVVHSHGWYQLAPFAAAGDGAELHYVSQLAGGRVLAAIIQEAPGGVHVQVADELSAAEQAQVSQQVTWMLGLEQEFTAFYSLAAVEPKLAHVTKAGHGRVLRSPTLFEDYDHIPVDSWALRLVSQEWHDGQPVERAQVEAAFAHWGEYQGLAFWFWQWSHNEG